MSCGVSPVREFVDTLVGWGPLGVLTLAALDSAGVPLPGGVDALLLLVSAMRPLTAWLAAAAAVIGSLLGNWVLFALARKGGEAYLARHTVSPRGQKLRRWFQHYGLITVFIPAFLPIPMPLKVPVLCAGALGIRRRAFLGTMLAARIPRYFGLAWLGSQLGDDALGWLRAHAWHLGVFALLLALFLFALVKAADYRRARQA
jgi:membrane protein DedA with SNARE-associated domain